LGLEPYRWTQDRIYKWLEGLDAEAALTACIVGEAAIEPFLGKLYVACTVRNRVADRRWPDSYQGVLSKRLHFSCFNEKEFRPEIMRPVREAIWWRECKYAAWGVVNDYVSDVTKGATHYWNPDIVQPSWTNKLKLLDKVGHHQFAKEIA